VKLQIQLPDEVAEKYAARLRPSQTLDQVLAIQLERFADADPRDRILLVLPVERAQLEALTTHLPLTSAADLVKRVEELAELSVGRIRFRFTPKQWNELKHRAERWRMTPKQFAEKIVRQLEEGFFTEMPRPGEICEDAAARTAPAPKKG
jgi:hypothetical protein